MARRYPKVYTIEEVARIFKLTPRAVRGLVRRGEIPAIKLGHQYRIPRSVLDRLFGQPNLGEDVAAMASPSDPQQPLGLGNGKKKNA